MNYFLGDCIGEGWWRWIFGVGFFSKNSVSHSKFVSTLSRGEGASQMWIDVDRGKKGGGESKITENVRISFMDGPCWYIKF